jgi:hypothetical protein
MSHTGDGLRRLRSTWFSLTQEQKELLTQNVVGDLMIVVALIGVFGWWGALFVVGKILSDRGQP